MCIVITNDPIKHIKNVHKAVSNPVNIAGIPHFPIVLTLSYIAVYFWRKVNFGKGKKFTQRGKKFTQRGKIKIFGHNFLL